MYKVYQFLPPSVLLSYHLHQRMTNPSVLQAYTSVHKAALNLKDNVGLARLMNTIMFHCRVVDELDEMLHETSDLSSFW